MTGGGRKFTKVLTLFHRAERACRPYKRRDAPALYFCVQHIKVKGEVVSDNHVGSAHIISEETDNV
jgi:hypothetical protein